MRTAIEDLKRKAKLAKLGRIVPAHQLQNVSRNELYRDVVPGSVVYSGQLNGRDVLISVYATGEQLRQQVAIMNNLAEVHSQYVIAYLGCCCLGELGLGQSSAATTASSTSFPNAIITERGRLGNLVEYFMNVNKVALPEQQTLILLKQVAEAVIAVHDHGFFLLRMSPANVQVFQLDEQGDCSDVMVKLVGFESVTNNADDMMPWQSLGLLPPEVIEQGNTAWSQSSVVWCFGVLVWKLFSSKRSLLVANSSFDFAISEGLHSGPIPAVAKPDQCPAATWQLAQKCIAVQPADRPSMQEIRKELDRLLLQLRLKQARNEEQQERRKDIVTVTPGPQAKRQRRDLDD